LPLEEGFWDYLFAVSKPWGLLVYEQDWFHYYAEKMEALQTDLFLGRKWMLQMDRAAQHMGIWIQICSALPRHVLESLEMPSVSQTRASADHFVSSEQWRLGISSMFADAIGIAPSKDNFWSKKYQPGNKYHKTEKSPMMEAVVALLSTGPLAPGDRIGYTDPDFLARFHTQDGTILKPSKPAMAVDAQILQAVFGGDLGPEGEVWSTYSEVGGHRFGVIFATDMKKPYNITPAIADFSSSENGEMYTYSYQAHPSESPPTKFSNEYPLLLDNCTIENICLHFTSPAFHFRNNKIIILGELSKILPISPKRVSHLEANSNDIVINIVGTAGEKVKFYFYSLQSKELIPIECTFLRGTKAATISISRRNCVQQTV